MNESDETLEQLSDRELLIKLMKRLDNFEKSTSIQLEAIREGLVANSIKFDRLEAKILNLNANFTEFSERLRQNDKQTLALE